MDSSKSQRAVNQGSSNSSFTAVGEKKEDTGMGILQAENRKQNPNINQNQNQNVVPVKLRY